jgi:hypothetical protein
MMVTVQLAMSTTTMKMATARWDTTTTMMTTDINDDDDDEGNDASWTGCDEVDNHNRDDGKDACALTSTTMPLERETAPSWWGCLCPCV